MPAKFGCGLLELTLGRWIFGAAAAKMRQVGAVADPACVLQTRPSPNFLDPVRLRLYRVRHLHGQP